MTSNKIINPARLFAFAALLLSTGAHAQLAHTYAFDDSGPLFDNTGDFPLSNNSTVQFGSEEGFAYCQFDGSSNHLVVDESAGIFELSDYTLSFWFRLETTSQSNWSGMFSSADNTQGGYQIDFHSGILRFLTGISGQTLYLNTTTELGTSEWHLLTISKDSIWVNQTRVDFGPSFNLPALKNFALGVNRGRNSSFKGDIADVRIYGAETIWDDATQQQSYAEGPGIPATPNPGTVILISRSDRGPTGLLEPLAHFDSPVFPTVQQ